MNKKDKVERKKIDEAWVNLLRDLACYNLEAMMYKNWELEEVVYRIARMDHLLGNPSKMYGPDYVTHLYDRGYMSIDITEGKLG